MKLGYAFQFDIRMQQSLILLEKPNRYNDEYKRQRNKFLI